MSDRDLLDNPGTAGVFFGIPIAALIVSSVLHVDPLWRTIIWTLSLATMGTACVLNALRCRRTHCYFTGPFFLVLAIVTLLFGIGLLPLGRFGWSILSLALLVGTVLLCCVPEAAFGRYRR